jgi:hypothetical protein
MNEEFVPFELVKKLKENGYNKPFYFYYRTDDQHIHHVNTVSPLIYSDKIDDEVIIAPTISQVLKWLRDEKKLHIEFVAAAYGYNYIVSDTPEKGGTDRHCSAIKYDGPNDGGAWDEYEDAAIAGVLFG